MKRLTILTFIIGVLVAPVQAQAQQGPAGAPVGFNGLVWDPPTQEYVVPNATRHLSPINHPRRHHSSSAT